VASLTLSQIGVSLSSYVDPNGFLFSFEDRLYRAILPERESFYRALLADAAVGELCERHGLVPTEIAPHAIPEVGCSLVLAHERIEPLTYCVEWCPSMLKRAAVQTLELCLDLVERDCLLQDAYPWNVLFAGSEPTFVDFTSVVPIESQLPWPAYQQFVNFFLNPLELAAMGKGKLARALLFDHIGGVSAADFDTARSASWTARHPLRSMGAILGRFTERRLQGNTELKRRLQQRAKASRGSADAARSMRLGFLRRLLRRVERIAIRPARSTWKGYHAEVDATIESDEKRRRIDAILAELAPESVLDVGCNEGRYSLMAARKGARVLSIDSSEECIESVYAAARHESLSVVPLVCDVLNPTPAFGFLSRQFPPFVERARSEVVLCLGLMHHLHVNGRQSLERIARLMRELATRAVIFEYVDPTDDNLHLLDHGRPIDYSLDAVQHELGRYFELSTFSSDRDTRQLILCKRRDVC
jgi:2-polyprenyl-3-methyl-5-hydroxy-6-metoxy-1,4-benzoquinol methylase